MSFSREKTIFVYTVRTKEQAAMHQQRKNI